MRNKILAISLLISLVTGLDLMAAVTINGVSSSFSTIYNALYYLNDHRVTATDGTITINVSGNIKETSTARTAFDLSRRNSAVNKIVISGEDNTKVTTSNFAYRIRFSNGADATVEISNIKFTGSSFFIAATYENANTHKATTYFHNCVFAPNVTYSVRAGSSGTMVNYSSDIYRFEYNTWEGNDAINYTINYNNSSHSTPLKFIFSNNNIYCFRGFSINANKNYKLDITMENNVLCHLQDFSAVEGVQHSVALLQINGAIYGDFKLTGNKMLGLFTFGDHVKAPALLLQHGTINYKGIKDDSNVIITGNTIQCDVYQFAWK